jgi:hypothetical protein
MIISASYKTDIPAFYGEWFMNRLKAGFCMMRNPMNRKPIHVSLERPEADGVVFWTKNFRPFLKYLDGFEKFRLPFYVSYTINGYPKSLESHVVDWRKSVEAVDELYSRHGIRSVAWRYDTIVLSSETSETFHVENFCRIADELSGRVDEVVISFMQLYQKTTRNLGEMERMTGNQWFDPNVAWKKEFAARLWELAGDRNIRLSICTQPELITCQSPARCIDTARLADLSGSKLNIKQLGNRPGCECAASRDIGDYDTCPHGCVYCYAVRNQPKAIERFRLHNPSSPFLFEDPGAPQFEIPVKTPSLFDDCEA